MRSAVCYEECVLVCYEMCVLVCYEVCSGVL